MLVKTSAQNMTAQDTAKCYVHLTGEVLQKQQAKKRHARGGGV